MSFVVTDQPNQVVNQCYSNNCYYWIPTSEGVVIEDASDCSRIKLKIGNQNFLV